MIDIIPKRYIFSFIGFLAFTLSVTLQSNLSLAIVYMVNRRNNSELPDGSSDECDGTATTSYHEENVPWKSEKFDWGPELVGSALAAEYYGMIIAFIPGGRLAEMYGGKKTLIGSMLLASTFTLLLPIAARISVYVFIVCRILVGLGTAPIFPILFYMLPLWIPISARSFNASLLFAGFGIGASVSYLVSGALCSSEVFGGWPSVFYFGGLMGFVICVLSLLLVYDSPNKHPTITKSELDYITDNITICQEKKNTFPWTAMLTSMPVWALALGYFGQFWILGFFSTSLPLYVGTILKLDSMKNGSLSCAPNIIRALFACFCSILMDFVLSKRNVPLVYVRKGATVINSFFACMGFIGVLYAGCDTELNIACFIVSGLTGDFLTFGVCLAAVDMAPAFAGTISGILSSIGTIPYFVLPCLIGYLTKDSYSMENWRHVYYCTIGVIVITTVIYISFGTSEPQPWAVNHKVALNRNSHQRTIKTTKRRNSLMDIT